LLNRVFPNDSVLDLTTENRNFDFPVEDVSAIERIRENFLDHPVAVV
jgi:hypothetical protein